MPAVATTLRPRRAGERDIADGPEASHRSAPAAAVQGPAWDLSAACRSRSFLTITLPFALGLLVQVGILTHQVSITMPILGTAGSAVAVAISVVTSLASRVVSGLFVDRLDRRMVACGNFLLQAAAMPLFMLTSPLSLYVACALLGVSVGNMVTLPGLIVQKEFPKAHFNRVVSLVLATCNFTYAFGPGLLGAIKTSTGSYFAALLVCCALQVAAAIIVLGPVAARRRTI